MCADEAGIEPRILEQAGSEVDLPEEIQVPGGRDAVGAERDAYPGIHEFRILADAGRALGQLERGRWAKGHVGSVVREQRDLVVAHRDGVSQDEIRAESAEGRDARHRPLSVTPLRNLR